MLLTKILDGIIKVTAVKKVLIVISLLLLITVNITGCGNKGLTTEQRQTYINMAIEFENKALQAQKQAEELWTFSYQRGFLDSQREALVDGAKAKEDLASEYRQQALKYRELAAK